MDSAKNFLHDGRLPITNYLKYKKFNDLKKQTDVVLNCKENMQFVQEIYKKCYIESYGIHAAKHLTKR